ncbi:MAG: TatD family hydrolase [Bacteroides sp.]|nr:TatD family hydrolase [Bacteroides sp.]
MHLIDTHSHIYLEDFSDDLSSVIIRAREAGLTHIFLPNIDKESIEPMLQVCRKYPTLCYPMMGLHPTSVDLSYQEELTVVEEQLKSNPDWVAVGEIGLDLYWDKTYLRQQTEAFDRQVRWALEYQLPVVVHCRDAFEELYQTLLPYKEKGLTGIFHSFTGTPEDVRKLMEFPGFLFGINGVVTFRNSSLPLTLKEVPLEKIVLETDAPYLTPVPFRGKRNESSYIRYTLSKVAEIYRKTEEEVAKITSDNALRLFTRVKAEKRF